MNTPVGIDPQMIANPPHYVQGRKIEPIQIIEEWSFCHHLGCVVKYVSRAGRKNPIPEQTRLEDLRKAEWYLLREINEKPCLFSHPRPFPTAPEAIEEDWRLPPSLSQVIFYLTSYQRLFYRLPLTKVVCLRQALTHLRAEIEIWECMYTLILANQSQTGTLCPEAKNQEQACPLSGGARINNNQSPYGTNIIIFNKGENPCNNQQN